MVTFICKQCYQEIPRFYALRKQENVQHGILIQTENVHPGKFNSAVDQTNFKEEIRFRFF